MKKKDAAELFSYIVDIVRAVRSNKRITLFRGGMEKLNFAQITALYYLFDSAGMTMSELSNSAGVKMPTMTDIVSPLVSAGYASRASSDKDRRKVIILLTTKGKKLVEYNKGIGIDYIEEYLSKLNILEQKTVKLFVLRTKQILENRSNNENR